MKIQSSGVQVSEFIGADTEHVFKMINSFYSKCGSLVEMHIERVLAGHFVLLGTIDQRHEITVNEGLLGEFALPHVAFKAGRKVTKRGGGSDLI